MRIGSLCSAAAAWLANSPRCGAASLGSLHWDRFIGILHLDPSFGSAEGTHTSSASSGSSISASCSRTYRWKLSAFPACAARSASKSGGNNCQQGRGRAREPRPSALLVTLTPHGSRPAANHLSWRIDRFQELSHRVVQLDTPVLIRHVQVGSDGQKLTQHKIGSNLPMTRAGGKHGDVCCALVGRARATLAAFHPAGASPTYQTDRYHPERP